MARPRSAVSESCHHNALDRGRGDPRSRSPCAALVDATDHRRGGGRVVADGGQAEQVGRQLRPVGVDDERAPDAERAAEQPGLEHHVVAW